MSKEVVVAVYNWLDEETDPPTKMSKELKVDFDFGEDVNDMMTQFSPEIVFHHARSNMRVSLQGYLRTLASQDLKENELSAKINEWMPPTGKPRGMSKIDKAKELISGLSEEDKQAFLEELGLT